MCCTREAARETLEALFALPFGITDIKLERDLLENLYAAAVGQ
ncbi:hypothetical protein [Natronolimnobius sp. AArcel1]|nr:hypothetical protein [Natronolimnobius sp. AArcel1]